MRIFAFHLLNDFSGSPKVLSQLIAGWVKNDIEVHVCSSFENHGFLSGLSSQAILRPVWYRFYQNKLLRLAALMSSQLLLIIKFFFIIKKDDIIYVNTVLPFGAALLGKIKGCRVIYHIHETTMKPAILKKALFGIAKFAADDVIYVSKYLANEEPFAGKSTHVLHNAIPEEFINRAKRIPRDISMPQNVLMVCSLKTYKGVREFVTLAARLKKYRFRLVVNASLEDIEAFFEGTTIPGNLELYPTQRDVIPHFAWADLVMNLSHPDGWVETFGLTIIEGMAFRIPAIVPPVGGITEVVDDGFNGYHINPHDIDTLEEAIEKMFQSSGLYSRLSKNAQIKLSAFREQTFIDESLKVVYRRNTTKPI
ncbi:MAG: glycosyltransferase family 4 protein [Bacteroidetes bacterium]|nr:glycosyltransferase family 4 protein [Bacteroidota bacterium]